MINIVYNKRDVRHLGEHKLIICKSITFILKNISRFFRLHLILEVLVVMRQEVVLKLSAFLYVINIFCSEKIYLINNIDVKIAIS